MRKSPGKTCFLRTLILFFLVVNVIALNNCGGGGSALPPVTTFTVTYDGNGNTGGAVPVDATNYEQGRTVTVSANTGSLVKSNFTFAGWNTLANGLGTDYAASGSATFTMGGENVILYAKWTANPTYTVTYDGNTSTGGAVPVDATNYEQGRTVTVSANTGSLVKSNFTFAGWNTQANGLGTDYAASGSATFTMGGANVTLYAKWLLNAPVINGTTPTSPANNNLPLVSGTAVADTTVSIYTNASCSGTALGSGTATGGNFSISVAVSDNTTTTLYANATDGSNISSCSAGVAYTEDSMSPSPPVITGANPAIGTAEPFAVIRIYACSSCGCPLAGQGNADINGAFNIAVAAGPPISATATDEAGNTSGCTNYP